MLPMDIFKTSKEQRLRMMWRPRVLKAWKNKHKNSYSPKSNLQIECNSYKILMTLYTEIEKNGLKIHIEAQNTLNSSSSSQHNECC